MNRFRRFFKAVRRGLIRKRLKTFEKGAVVLKPGCILKCDLGVLLEHTGVYIGKGKIVGLNRHGQIKTETPKTFFPPGTNPESSKIYVACYGKTNEVLHAGHVARNAKHNIMFCLTTATVSPQAALREILKATLSLFPSWKK